MHLVINIPCFNEEQTLPIVLAELPKQIEGISKITVQVVDDGSSDGTVAVAQKHGCRIIRHQRNRGLGNAFKSGLNGALAVGADILVNTDADNQYPAKYITELIQPIIDNNSDIVVGNRQPWKVKHFSRYKRLLQLVGNFLVRCIADCKVPDMISGFRAYSREAMLNLNVTTKFSYVLDTIVQASKKGLLIKSVPVTTNPPTRESRLFKGSLQHIRKSAIDILRLYLIYEPFKTFFLLAMLLAAPGIALIVRFLIYYTQGQGDGYIQSLVISVVFILLSAASLIIGIVAGLISINRLLIEDGLAITKRKNITQESS